MLHGTSVLNIYNVICIGMSSLKIDNWGGSEFRDDVSTAEMD